MTILNISSAVPCMDLDNCKSRLVWANQGEVAPRYINSTSSFADMTACWLIQRGRVRVVEKERVLDAKAGQWLFPGTEATAQHFSPRAQIISIRFQLHLLGGAPLFCRRRSRIFKAATYPNLESSSKGLVDLLKPWGAEESLLVGRENIPLSENFRIEAQFYKWLSVYVEAMVLSGEEMTHSKDKDDRVMKAMRYLEHFPMREPFSETALSHHCGLSVNQLNRLFKKESGETPFQYYDRQRLELACHSLEETRLQVKEIAFELGFSSSPHFTNWFKKRRGLSPRGFRG